MKLNFEDNINSYLHIKLNLDLCIARRRSEKLLTATVTNWSDSTNDEDKTTPHGNRERKK